MDLQMKMLLVLGSGGSSKISSFRVNLWGFIPH